MSNSNFLDSRGSHLTGDALATSRAIVVILRVLVHISPALRMQILRGFRDEIVAAMRIYENGQSAAHGDAALRMREMLLDAGAVIEDPDDE